MASRPRSPVGFVPVLIQRVRTVLWGQVWAPVAGEGLAVNRWPWRTGHSLLTRNLPLRTADPNLLKQIYTYANRLCGFCISGMGFIQGHPYSAFPFLGGGLLGCGGLRFGGPCGRGGRGGRLGFHCFVPSSPPSACGPAMIFAILVNPSIRPLTPQVLSKRSSRAA